MPETSSGRQPGGTEQDRLFNLSLDVLCVAGLDGRIKWINPAIETTLGYSAEELTGKPFLGYVHPDDQAATSAEVRKLSTGEPTICFENRYRSKDGSYKWLAWTAFPVVEEGLAYCVGRDITERRRAEHTQRLTQLSVDHAVDAVFWHQPDSRFIYVNEAACRMLGYSREQLLSMTINDINPESTPEACGGLWNDLRQRGYLRFEASLRTGDDRLVPAEISATHVAFGEEEYCCCFARDITERKRAEEALRETVDRLATAQQVARLGFLDWDLKTDEIFLSDEMYRVYGLKKGEVRTTPELVARVVHPDDLKSVQENLELAIRGERHYDIDHRIVRPDGTVLWVHAEAGLTRDSNGAPERLLGTAQDITTRKRAEEELRSSRQKYLDLVNGIDGIVWAANAEQLRFNFVSRQAERLLGYPAERWTTEPDFWRDHIHPQDQDSAISSLRRAARTGEPCEIEYRMLARDGHTVWLRDFVRVTVEADRPAALQGVMVDITESKRLEETLHFTALHDPLTFLPNRALFEERLEQALRRARRHADYLCAVLFLDLDHFKLINDSHGHQVGDRLLVAVGGRLAKCIRDSDTVARFGGDEFAILLQDFGDSGRVEEVAERILIAVHEPFQIDAHELFTTASIGIDMGHPSDRGPKDILRNADIAMYRAKDAGGNRSMTFDVSMRLDILKRTSLEKHLREAIERQEFQLHYQEIRATSSGRLAGLEALLRWRHPERGLLRPEQFLSVAEDTGLILPIGWWVFEEACRQITAWRKREALSFSVSVNLSGRQLAQPDLVGWLARALETAGLPGDALTLEVTETAIMENTTVAIRKLEQLNSLGVHLVIDDFGIGYSSLSRLKDLPIETVKINRAFVKNLQHKERDSAVMEAMINLGRNLGLTTVAEGVETAEQLARLRELGCDYVQGNFLSPPLDADSTTARLRAATKEASASG